MQNTTADNSGLDAGMWNVDADVQVPLKAAQPQVELTAEETDMLVRAAAEALAEELRAGLEMTPFVPHYVGRGATGAD